MISQSNGEIEKPHGEWNVVEIIAQGDNVKHYLNGKLVNEGTNAYPASGRILIQSEGAEFISGTLKCTRFRDIKVYPLRKYLV